MRACVCVCVSAFGFSQQSFSGIEQGETYTVQLEGSGNDAFFFFLSLDLGTASKYDSHYQCIFTIKHYVAS